MANSKAYDMNNPLRWMHRCDVCGWPLESDRSKGCAEFDCSMRPQPDGYGLTHSERLAARAEIRRLETALRVASAECAALRDLLQKMAEWDCDCEFLDYGQIAGGKCPSCLSSEALGRLQGSESADCNAVSATPDTNLSESISSWGIDSSNVDEQCRHRGVIVGTICVDCNEQVTAESYAKANADADRQEQGND